MDKSLELRLDFIEKEAKDLREIMNKEDAPANISKEERLKGIFDGCVLFFSKEYPKSVYLKKDNKILFEQDFKNGILWCLYSEVWSIFEKEYLLKYDEIQTFIKDWVGNTLKIGSLTPRLTQHVTGNLVGNTLKIGSLTPSTERK